eukprot:TRINITY_DN2509_c0_g1_i1.p1 TRINITY_DN2509_c0_g1~~TRINITY_DN2509_c0_g1_i1.p1  ORF type:complete len:150 (-),score=19.70 TRINITY_DN2509_c0_g1_i1:33-482(-)
MLVRAVDEEIGEHGEVGFVSVAGANVLENQKSLVVILWIKVGKLRASKSKNIKTLGAVLGDQFIGAIEVSRGVTSEGCDVDDQQNGALVVRKADVHAIKIGCHEIANSIAAGGSTSRVEALSQRKTDAAEKQKKQKNPSVVFHCASSSI